jgi:hypothetical protein
MGLRHTAWREVVVRAVAEVTIQKQLSHETGMRVPAPGLRPRRAETRAQALPGAFDTLPGVGTRTSLVCKMPGKEFVC